MYFISLLEVRSDILCATEQVASTGKTSIASGLSIAAGGLNVAGGLAVATGTSFVSGNVGIDSGSLAITSPGGAASAIDVYASHATFGGNAILGHVAAAEYNGNAMQLLEGNNVLFQVRFVEPIELLKLQYYNTKLIILAW